MKKRPNNNRLSPLKQQDMVNSHLKNKTLKLRLCAFFIDYALIAVIVSAPFSIHVLSDNQQPLHKRFFPWFWIMIIGALMMFIFKDVTGRSLGKRVLKLAIFATNGGDIACWKLIVRNIGILIWPIDVLVLFSTERRILDKALGLDVADSFPPVRKKSFA